MLVSVRYSPFKSFSDFEARVMRASDRPTLTGEMVMLGLLEAMVDRIAYLLELSGDEQAALLPQLNGFFSIVEQMSAVDTSGVDPLYTPLSAVQEVALRLREDRITETDQRALNQRSAPAVEDGLFLVPKVIE